MKEMTPELWRESKVNIKKLVKAKIDGFVAVK